MEEKKQENFECLREDDSLEHSRLIHDIEVNPGPHNHNKCEKKMFWKTMKSEVSVIEEIPETSLAMDMLLLQVDKLLESSFGKVKKRITKKKRREVIFLLKDRSGSL